MAWTAPRTWVAGELVTASIMNLAVRDNLLYLKDAPTFDSNVTVTGTLTAAGNVGLASTKKLYLDGVAMTGDTYIVESAANTLQLVSGGVAVHIVSGSVGIGTTSPQNLLSVSNAGAAGLEFAPATGVILAYNRSTVAYAPFGINAASMVFSIAGTSAATLDSSGRFGIGNTSPQNLLVVSNGGAAGIEFVPATGTILGYNRNTVAAAPLVIDGSAINLKIAGTDRLVIDATGAATGLNIGVTGYFFGTEIAAPGAPLNNMFRLYAEDNGGGKTKLMVIFNTGAAQQLAIQP